MSQALSKRSTLDVIPDAEMDRLAALGFDWLLSVWQTGPAAQAVSRSNAGWRKECQETLPELREEDIASSGFAIQNLHCPSRSWVAAVLAVLRQRLQ